MLFLNIDNIDSRIANSIIELENDFPIRFSSNGLLLRLYHDKENKIEFDKNSKVLKVYFIKETFIYFAIHKLMTSKFDKSIVKKFNKKLEELAFQIDCSRNNVFKVNSMKMLIRYLAFMGYDVLYLYLEDTYQLLEDDYFGKFRGRYSLNELREIVEYGEKFDIEIRASIQTLAHLDTMFKWVKYESIHDNSDILLCNNNETYKLIDLMFRNLRKALKTKIINVGMDEARLLGKGKYNELYGYLDKKEILYNHLLKVNEIAKRYDFRIEMWSDVFFSTGYDLYNLSEGIEKKVPDDVTLVYWEYTQKDKKEYQRIINMHKKQASSIKVAGGAYNWLGYSPNNQYSIIQTKNLFEVCLKNKIKDFILTTWNDDGGETNVFLVLPVLNYLSNLTYGNRNTKNDFKILTNIPISQFLLLDQLNNLVQDIDVSYYVNNSNKYLLFNDLLLGTYDQFFKDFNLDNYYKIYKKIRVNKSIKFYYLFYSLKKLALILNIKCEITWALRKVYQEKNKDKIRDIILGIDNLIKEFKLFYKAYKKGFLSFSKPQGFDVQDLRFGGTIFRLRHVREILNDYISNKIDVIEELEEEQLDFFGNGKNYKDDLNYIEYSYSANSSRNLNK